MAGPWSQQIVAEEVAYTESLTGVVGLDIFLEWVMRELCPAPNM